MSRYPIDSAEMAKRQDLDFIASLKMVGEGSPHYDPIIEKEEKVEVEVEENDNELLDIS